MLFRVIPYSNSSKSYATTVNFKSSGIFESADFVIVNSFLSQNSKNYWEVWKREIGGADTWTHLTDMGTSQSRFFGAQAFQLRRIWAKNKIFAEKWGSRRNNSVHIYLPSFDETHALICLNLLFFIVQYQIQGPCASMGLRFELVLS